MIVQIHKPFLSFAENQIIDTKKYGLNDDGVAQMVSNNVVSIVFDYTEKLDVVSDYLQYFGKSYAGAIENEAVWTITKTTKSGTVTTRDVFHNVSWADRNVL